MGDSPKVDMLERRRIKAVEAKKKKKRRNRVLLFLALGLVALGVLIYIFSRPVEALKGSFLKQELVKKERRTVFQPRLHLADGSKAYQGTAFLLNFNGIVYAVTCNHFMNFEGSKLQKIELCDPVSREVLFTVDKCLGVSKYQEGSLLHDFIFLPVDMKSEHLEKCNVLNLNSKNYVYKNSIYFPEKSQKYQRRGEVIDTQPDFVAFGIEGIYTFTAESGSPIIMSGTNEVAGIIARVGENQRYVLSPPIRFLKRFLNSNNKYKKLADVVGRLD